MSEHNQWRDPETLEPAPIYVPETLYDPNAILPREIEQGLAISGTHYLGHYPRDIRKSLYLHDIAYWSIVETFGGDEALAQKAIRDHDEHLALLEELQTVQEQSD